MSQILNVSGTPPDGIICLRSWANWTERDYCPPKLGRALSDTRLWSGKRKEDCLSLPLLSLATALALYRAIPVGHGAPGKSEGNSWEAAHRCPTSVPTLPSSPAPKAQALGCKANLPRNFHLAPEYWFLWQKKRIWFSVRFINKGRKAPARSRRGAFSSPSPGGSGIFFIRAVA